MTRYSCLEKTMIVVQNALRYFKKLVLKIILDNNYIWYEVACTLFDLMPLEYRSHNETFKSSRGKEFLIQCQKLLKQEQAQLRLCKLGPGTFFLIRFFSEIKFLSVALLSQASLVVGCMLTSTNDNQAKFQLPTWSRSPLIWVLKNRNALTN